MIEVESALLPSSAHELSAVLAHLDREAGILDALVVLRDVEIISAGDQERAAALRAALLRTRNMTFLTSVKTMLGGIDSVIALRVAVVAPTPAMRAEGWTTELADVGASLSGPALATLAGEYSLSRSEIATAVRLAVGYREPSKRVSFETLAAAARSQLRSELARFAHQASTRARLGDLVLPDETLEQVRELIHAVWARPLVMREWGFAERHATGKGIAALFNGAPVTGKTFTAGVIANELGLPLFRIDVSTIVDRYVGETEKNLARLFEEAKGTNAALLFDEADSLFSTRVTVRDAIDRHSNMQVNMLLQLIEDYEGVVLLTTNMKTSIDSAFLRRIAYKINFELPDEAERFWLWKKHLPPSVPCTEDVDPTRLAAEFQLTGGEIKNAVLRAALMTGGTQAISDAMLRRSVHSEMEAAGKIVRRA